MTNLENDYDEYVITIRKKEYPSLKDAVYLDHAGTTPCAKSLMARFSADLTENLYGNPHSASSSSQLSSQKVEDIRLKALRLFHADPAEFDLVFVANTTAAIKLVMDAFQAYDSGFWYGYHRDSHTSLIGVREVARKGHRCFVSDKEVEEWLHSESEQSVPTCHTLKLFAYPAQSNMNGRRLPMAWCSRANLGLVSGEKRVYSLLDAAGIVSTSGLDLSDASKAADFTALSFYKMFGFPDLGALIVKKDSGKILRQARYFGGGNVEIVVCLKEQWHISKSENLHEALEHGTLPIHNILALGSAIDVHHDLFGTLDRVSRHTGRLAKALYEGLKAMRHSNGKKVCEIYKDPHAEYENPTTQGPIIAFNMRNSHGNWVNNSEVEKLAAIKNIHLRSGGLCNPGGIAHSLDLHAWEMKENFSSGFRCGSENDVFNGKPTGMIRISLGAMSTSGDVTAFLNFITEFFIETQIDLPKSLAPTSVESLTNSGFFVESLMVYPIKSCAGYRIPSGRQWHVYNEGLAWDREWCLVHEGSGLALSQKRYPKMALIRPSIDLDAGLLRIRFDRNEVPSVDEPREIFVPLSANPTYFDPYQRNNSRVCGDEIQANIYQSREIASFFSTALGAPCQLARFPAGGTALRSRHAKAHLHEKVRTQSSITIPPLLLSNESPILTINRSSLNRLNEEIKASGGKAAQAEVFRANIVVAQDWSMPPGSEHPYIEDTWQALQIGQGQYRVMGPCRRCQMVCVDQMTAEKNENPFVTLAKTRRFAGKVFFGQHTCLVPYKNGRRPGSSEGATTIMVGDVVRPFLDIANEPP